MNKMVLLRHGESLWNRENIFTGWTDIDLSEKGMIEARNAAQLLKREGFVFDTAFTSMLKRAIRTLWIVLDEMDLMWIPVHRSWRLNERHYGALQGQNKNKIVAKVGERQVGIWRRSYINPPPPLDRNDTSNPAYDIRYNDSDLMEKPLTESLKDTYQRLLPYWHEVIAPTILTGKQVIISAHGNSLRALVKYLSKINDTDIVQLEVPTGVPLVYELDSNLLPLKTYYLGNKTKQ